MQFYSNLEISTSGQIGKIRNKSERIGTNRNESEKFERDRISAIRARTYYKLQKMFSFTSFKQLFDFLR